jgi:RHS repeat-associated protein
VARTYLFWEPLSDNILQERDESGALVAEYTAEPGLYGNVISQRRSGVESQFHFDAVGSTLALTDDNEQVTDARAYTAFGETAPVAGSTDNRFNYLGRAGFYQAGAAATYMARARVYRPNLSRWLTTQVDETPFANDDSYRLGSNSPISVFDAAGHSIAPAGTTWPICFYGGSDFVPPVGECAKRSKRPLGRTCYTPQDVVFCYRYLRFGAFGGYYRYGSGCAGQLLYNFLTNATSPYCPTECITAIKQSAWYHNFAVVPALKSVLDSVSCSLIAPPGKNLTGRFGGPCQDPFHDTEGEYPDADLARAIGGIDSAQMSVLSRARCHYARPPCTCCCRVSVDIDFSLTDLYDFKSSLSAADLPRSPAWCGAVLEDIGTRFGRRPPYSGKTFSVACHFNEQLEYRGCNIARVDDLEPTMRTY